MYSCKTQNVIIWAVFHRSTCMVVQFLRMFSERRSPVLISPSQRRYVDYVGQLVRQRVEELADPNYKSNPESPGKY